MDANESLRNEVRSLLISNLMLQVPEQDLGDDLPLFGPGGLGLDSVDALQIVVALDKVYGLKIPDANVARGILQSVSTIASAIARHRLGAT